MTIVQGMEELAHWVGSYAQRHMADEVETLDLTTTLPNTAARSHGFAEGLRQVLPNGRILLSVDGGGLRGSTVKWLSMCWRCIRRSTSFSPSTTTRLRGLWTPMVPPASMNASCSWSHFGLEGTASRRLLQEGGPFKAGVAMFPEMVGRACIDATLCAYHNCAMPRGAS